MTIRSWLYVPGDRPDRFGKAVDGPADAVVIDLEDAVSPERKVLARQHTAEFLAGRVVVNVHVRINSLDAGGLDDLAALRNAPPAGLRLPKAEQPSQVRAAAEKAPGVPLWPIVESALGVEYAYRLATSHPQVAGLLLGHADLTTDIGTTHPDMLDALDRRVVLAAAAAGLGRPPMSVYPDLDDLDGLARDCRRGRARGFFGRSVLHPRQVAVVNDAFDVDQEALLQARHVLSYVAEHGTGAGTDRAGRFTDAAVVRRARKLIDQEGPEDADS